MWLVNWSGSYGVACLAAVGRRRSLTVTSDMQAREAHAHSYELTGSFISILDETRYTERDRRSMHFS